MNTLIATVKSVESNGSIMFREAIHRGKDQWIDGEFVGTAWPVNKGQAAKAGQRVEVRATGAGFVFFGTSTSKVSS